MTRASRHQCSLAVRAALQGERDLILDVGAGSGTYGQGHFSCYSPPPVATITETVTVSTITVLING